MAENINLLPQQNDENVQQARSQKLINRASAIVLVVTIVAVVGLFAGQFILGQQLQAVEDDISIQTQRIQDKKTEEGIQRSLIGRVTALDTFFAEQNNFSNFFTEFGKTLPDTIRLTDMIVSDEKQVTVTGSVASYAELAGFYSKLRLSGAEAGSEIGTDFVNPLLTSIGRSEESGAIEFSMTFTINPTLLRATATTGASQ